MALFRGGEGQRGAVAELSRSAWRRDSGHDIVFGSSAMRDETKELAAACGLGNYGSVAMAVKRYERKLAEDAAELRRMHEITQMLNVKM